MQHQHTRVLLGELLDRRDGSGCSPSGRAAAPAWPLLRCPMAAIAASSGGRAAGPAGARPGRRALGEMRQELETVVGDPGAHRRQRRRGTQAQHGRHLLQAMRAGAPPAACSIPEPRSGVHQFCRSRAFPFPQGKAPSVPEVAMFEKRTHPGTRSQPRRRPAMAAFTDRGAATVLAGCSCLCGSRALDPVVLRRGRCCRIRSAGLSGMLLTAATPPAVAPAANTLMVYPGRTRRPTRRRRRSCAPRRLRPRTARHRQPRSGVPPCAAIPPRPPNAGGFGHGDGAPLGGAAVVAAHPHRPAPGR